MTSTLKIENSPFIFKLDQVAVMLLLCGYFFIPIAPAPVHIAIFSSLIISFFSKTIRARYKLFLAVPVFKSFFIFYVILIASGLYGSGGIGLKLNYLGKYLEIGYMPFLAAICLDNRYREKSLHLFSFAMLITLAISYLIFFGLNFTSLNLGLKMPGTTNNATVFKYQITHNFFMAFAVMVWVQRANHLNALHLKVFYFLVSLLGLANIILMVEGRTGYVTLVAIGLAILFNQMSIKKIVIGFLLGVICIAGVYKFVPKVQLRVDKAISEVVNWKPNVKAETSMGLRMEFWFGAYQIIKKAPLLGFGVAGFESEYKEISSSLNLTPSINPHNQYLLFLCQIGIVGLIAFIYLNYVVWRESNKLEYRWRVWVRALLLGYASANIFNSMLLDFAEGIFFSASLAFAFAPLLASEKFIEG